jgi:hypothetical protein
MRDLRGSTTPYRQQWHQADKGQVAQAVFEYVQQVEKNQFDLFDRFEKLECLYDPNANNTSQSLRGTEQLGLVTENVVASNIDTVTAAIAATDVRARFMTDEADWSTQRTAKRLEWYSEGLSALLDIHARTRLAFKEAAKKGTGLVKVYADGFNQIRIDAVRCDDIIVDEVQCRNGAAPKQLHQRMTNVDRDELISQFPEFEAEILRAQSGTGITWRAWAGYRPINGDNLVVIESWKLPIGVKGSKGYRPGRHTITIDGCDLLDEDYHKAFFPFARIVWSERTNGWYGISLAERIAGIQRALNKRNWQIDRNLDQVAVPTTFVRPIDANLSTKATRAGGITVYKGDEPKTVFPIAVSAETYQNRNDMKAAAYEESGVSRLAAQSVKPAGLDSGVAMREYRDQTTQRFALQEKAYERLVLDVIVLALDVCKDLGAAAPVITRKAKFGARKVKWTDVDMGDVRVQIAAASTLSRTPAGRYQTALEWAQAGVITTDEWRRLTQHPDLDRVLSLYTQGIESVERDIELIEDGETAVPEPFGNLELMVRVGQVAYLRDRDLGAPEEVLEGLRQYVELAADMVAKKTDAANANMVAAMPMDDPMAAAPIPGGMPAGGNVTQPIAALAPQAMDLMAS